jgi:hypothetical protein
LFILWRSIGIQNVMVARWLVQVLHPPQKSEHPPFWNGWNHEVKITIKSWSCPNTHHEGAWGERRHRSYSFSTSALDGGEWSASRPGRALVPRKGPPVPTVQEAGWAPEPIWTQRLDEKSFRLCRGSNLDRPVVQPVGRHYIDWATRLTKNYDIEDNFNGMISLLNFVKISSCLKLW